MSMKGKTVDVNGVAVPFDKLPKENQKAIEEAEKAKEQRRAERIEAAKPIPFSVSELAKARKEIAPFAKSLTSALEELGKVGMKFTEMRKDGTEVLGDMGTYKVRLTFEYSDEVFPKPVIVARASNVAEGENVIEHAWSAFVHKDKYNVFENQLLDYVMKQRPDGRQTELEEEDI